MAKNYQLTIRREQKFVSEHNNGCNLGKLVYTMVMYTGGKPLYTWRIHKYQGIWLEDGNDHVITLLVPYVNLFFFDLTNLFSSRVKLPAEFASDQRPVGLLYIDGQYICPARATHGVNYPGHCIDKNREGTPNPINPQEITNTKCKSFFSVGFRYFSGHNFPSVSVSIIFPVIFSSFFLQFDYLLIFFFRWFDSLVSRKRTHYLGR